MKRIGTCPLCHKGQILEFEDKLQCNYVAYDQQICNFFIYKSYSKKLITPEMLFDILHNYQTKFYNDFVNETGQKFEAALKIVNGYLSYHFKDQIINGVKCVSCDGNILRTLQGFGCENYFNRKCGMFIYKSYNGVVLTEDQVKLLVSGLSSSFIDFTSNEGNKFSAKLYVNDLDFQILFDYTIGSCPKCETGSILKMEKFFGCSNFLSDKKCDFIIWPSIFGYMLSFEDVEELLVGNSTEVKSFEWKDKKFEGML